MESGALDLQLGELDFTSSDPVDLSGLEEELKEYENHEVVRDILRSGHGSELRDRVAAVENRLHQLELDSIQDYVVESDNLVALREQIRGCDTILETMEGLLGGFQNDLGKISSEIKTLQEQSFTMSLKLRNRKAAESQLGQFIEDMSIPPKLISGIVDAEPAESYVQYLVQLHNKLEFAATKGASTMALQDVETELERLRVKAAAKVREFLLQRFYGLRKPKTNIQILQQSVFLKFKYFVKFLQQHGQEVFAEVRTAYVETLSRIYRSALSKYVIALNQLQVDSKVEMLAGDELQGVSAPRGASSSRGSVFSLGARSAVMRDLDNAPPLIAHQAEAAGERFQYEVLFRSAHKLLMDSATSEYLFSHEFWPGDNTIFKEVFAPAVAAVEENLQMFLPNCQDIVTLLLMIRVNREHQMVMSRRRAPCLDIYLDRVSLLLWPRFKAVLDAHIASFRNVPLAVDSLQAQPLTRRYADLAVALHSMRASGGSDGQLEHNIERLRTVMFELLLRLAKSVTQRKQRMVFLVNNYDAILNAFREASKSVALDAGLEGADTCADFTFFDEQLTAQIHLLVDDELADQFNPLITFVQRAEEAYKQQEHSGAPLPQFSAEDAEPVLRDFGMRWQMSVEEIHRSISASFGNSQRAMDLLQRTLSQLLLFYTRLTGPEGVLAVHCGPEGAALCRNAVPTGTILTEIRRLLQHRPAGHA